MKNKNIIATILLIVFSTSVAAQEQSHALFGMRTGTVFTGNLSLGMDQRTSVLGSIGTRWYLGAAFKLNILSSMTREVENFPLENFRINTNRVGVGPIVRYFIPVQCGNQSVSFSAYVSSNTLAMRATDERYEGTDSDGDVTNYFKLISNDGKFWNNFVLTLEISYSISIEDGLNLGLFLGCDATPYIKKSFRDKSITSTSNEWDDFNTYYGKPCINIFKETATGMRMNSPVLFYFGVAIEMLGIF